MKIIHCCLAAFYIDNFSYQENILPRMHKLQQHDVCILASTETYLPGAVLGYKAPGSYLNSDGIPVTRIPYVKWLPHFVAKKLRIYKGVSKFIADFKPDVIFVHDCQFISISEIASFAKQYPDVRIYVDGHTDFINSARTWVSKNILHKIIYKWCAKKIEKYTRKFYGVLPLRVDFFVNVYGIDRKKVELLNIGADTTEVDLDNRDQIKKEIRKELNIPENDFVIITGGKIDKRKNIHILMQAVSTLQHKDIKLIVFGMPNKEMKQQFDELVKLKNMVYLGWLPSEKSTNYFLAADVAFFPGTHSVLWEQAIGLGLPSVFKKWDGIQHVNVGGNCLFIDEVTASEIQEKILMIYDDSGLLAKMTRVARDRGMKEFSYYEIAKKAIAE